MSKREVDNLLAADSEAAEKLVEILGLGKNVTRIQFVLETGGIAVINCERLVNESEALDSFSMIMEEYVLVKREKS